MATAANPATKLIADKGGGLIGGLGAGTKTGIAIMAALVLYLIAKNRLGIYLGIITG